MPRKITLSRHAGMTLLEVLVALVIFTIIAAAGYSGLHQGVSVQRQLQSQQEYWRRLESVMLLLEQDLEQTLALAPRVPLWDAVAFRGYASAASDSLGEFIKITRGSHHTFRTEAGPFLRIAYRVRDGMLYRVTWPGVNIPENEQGIESELIDGIEGIELRYLHGSRRWVDRWPMRFTAQETGTVPRAVEARFLMADGTEINRVFYVGPPE